MEKNLFSNGKKRKSNIFQQRYSLSRGNVWQKKEKSNCTKLQGKKDSKEYNLKERKPRLAVDALEHIEVPPSIGDKESAHFLKDKAENLKRLSTEYMKEGLEELISADCSLPQASYCAVPQHHREHPAFSEGVRLLSIKNQINKDLGLFKVSPTPSPLNDCFHSARSTAAETASVSSKQNTSDSENNNTFTPNITPNNTIATKPLHSAASSKQNNCKKKNRRFMESKSYFAQIYTYNSVNEIEIPPPKFAN